jgi:hypothetical protein
VREAHKGGFVSFARDRERRFVLRAEEEEGSRGER